MTAPELFEALGPHIAPALEAVFQRRDLCILSTRVAVEVGAYFGIEVTPLPVRVMVYNAAFARHVASGSLPEGPVDTWSDGSWSVGIGFGGPMPGRWKGHLIAVADGYFGDFSIGQAERLEHGIHTGSALIGPFTGRPEWDAFHAETGTSIEYQRIDDDSWRNAPDWKDARRRKAIVGHLIRTVRDGA